MGVLIWFRSISKAVSFLIKNLKLATLLLFCSSAGWAAEVDFTSALLVGNENMPLEFYLIILGLILGGIILGTIFIAR